MGNIFSSVMWKKSSNFNLDSPKKNSGGSKRMSTKSEILLNNRPLDNSPENQQFERNDRKTRSLHSPPNKSQSNQAPKTRQTHSCLLTTSPTENTATNPILKSLQDIQLKAEKFESDIEIFQKSDDSMKYYYIEENLKRCLDELDEMGDLVFKDQAMKMERKKVYRIVFKLLQRLDEKAEKNIANLS